MMPEILTESFCERCGTRYTFEAAAPVKAKKLGKFKTLSKGLKNYVLSDETSMDEAMAAARGDEERELTSQQLEAFQSTFNFCMTCRQYTCANCWNTAEGACLTCAPLNGYVTPSTTFLDLAPVVPIEPLAAATSPWPTLETPREPIAAEAATPWPIETPASIPPPVVAAIPAEDVPVVDGAATAWPLAAEQAVAPEAVAEEVVAEEVVAEEVVAEVELTAVPEAAEWASAEAEAFVVAEPEITDDIQAVAESEPETAEADVAAVLEVAPETTDLDVADAAAPDIEAEPERAHIDTFAFESDIAPAVAELPDTDLRAADAARRTSDLLARLRPTASTPPDADVDAVAATSLPTETPIVELIGVTPPATEKPAPVQADFAADEADIADYVIADYAATDPTPDEAVALDPWAPETPAALPPNGALPPDLLEIIGPPIEAAPEPAAEIEAEPAIELVPEPLDVAAEAVEEIAAASTEPAPEPARADVVEQPTWHIVAPDPTAAPTNGHTPHPEPAQPAAVAKAPVEPAAPVEPQWPAPPAAAPLEDAPYLLSRGISDTSEGLWAASARGVVAQTPGAPVLAVQTCGSCGLSLSATARFCRRCGSRQGA